MHSFRSPGVPPRAPGPPSRSPVPGRAALTERSRPVMRGGISSTPSIKEPPCPVPRRQRCERSESSFSRAFTKGSSSTNGVGATANAPPAISNPHSTICLQRFSANRPRRFGGERSRPSSTASPNATRPFRDRASVESSTQSAPSTASPKSANTQLTTRRNMSACPPPGKLLATESRPRANSRNCSVPSTSPPRRRSRKASSEAPERRFATRFPTR
jgi:hypothetical protein